MDVGFLLNGKNPDPRLQELALNFGCLVERRHPGMTPLTPVPRT